MTSTESPRTGSTRAEVPAGSGWPTRRSVGLLTQSAVHAGALLRSWSRDAGVMMQSLLFPLFMLLMFQLVLGKTVTAMGGGDSLYRNTGLVALVGALYGTVTTALSLIGERESGLLSRLWTMPVPRAGFIGGRLLAEAARTGAATVLLFAVAAILGFRFDQGLLAGLGAIGVPVLFGVGVAVPVIALATVSAGAGVVQQLGGLFLFLLFFNTGFAPITEYPGWLQPVVRYQPMSPAVDAVRGLTEGGAVAGPLALTLAWTVGFVVVFGPAAVRGYRRAAEGR